MQPRTQVSKTKRGREGTRLRGQCRQGGISRRDTRVFCCRMRSNRSGCHLERRHSYPGGPPDSDARRCRVGTFAAPQRVFECVSARPLIPACEPQRACDPRTDRRHRGQLWQERRRPRVRRACRRSLRRCREHAPGRLAAAEPSGRRRAATADWCGAPVICYEARKSVGG